MGGGGGMSPKARIRRSREPLAHAIERYKEDGVYFLVDLDRTLAEYADWDTQGDIIGAPIPLMVERVQRWLHTGMEVRIFTARASDLAKIPAIESWCISNLGQKLKVQNWKDHKCVGIWDDLAVTVEANTGFRWTIGIPLEVDPIAPNEEQDMMRRIDRARHQAIELEDKRNQP